MIVQKPKLSVSFTRSLADKRNVVKTSNSLTRSLASSLTRSLASSLTRSLASSLTRSLASSLTCKLKKINDYKCFLLKVLQVNETLRDFHFIPNLQVLRCPM